MKKINVFVLCFLFAVSGFANISPEAESLDLPEGLEVMSSGYPEAPIVQCPRPDKKYIDMLSQLDNIKNRIKSEACRNSGEISAIESGVTDLQSLITDKRKSFIELVKKGTSVGSQLSSKEVKDLQSYIDQVVKKASVVTGFLNNKACFDEPTKFSALGTLSSVIGEISGAVGALAGPFGAKISLAGGVISGLLKSINTIVTARTSYDVDVETDRVNYLNTLCAYYDFKPDFDKVTKTLAYDRKLRKARDAAKDLLQSLSITCPECKVAMDDFDERFYNSEEFEVRRGESALDDRVEILAADELLADDLIGRYFESEALITEGEIGAEAAPSPVSQEDQRATVTALLIKAWAETERQKLMEDESQGASDELRKPIVQRQKQIEDVLVVSVAPDYVYYHNKRLERDFKKLKRTGSHIVSQMYSYRPKPDPNMDYRNLGSSLAVAFHDLFRTDLEFQESTNPLANYDEALMWDFVDRMSSQLMDDFDILRRQFALMKQRCEFFDSSSFDLKRNPSLARACSRAERTLEEVKKEIAKVELTSFGTEFPFYFKKFKPSTIKLASDWLNSVTLFLNIEGQKRS